MYFYFLVDINENPQKALLCIINRGITIILDTNCVFTRKFVEYV